MASRALRLTLVPWLVLFAACSGDRVSEQIDEVSEALSATDRILTFEGTISSAAGADWRPVTGTATSSTTHSEGAHSIALGGSWNPLAQSAALTALGTLTGPPSIDVELPAGYLPQTNYYGQIALYVTCGSSIVNQYLGPVSLSGPTGSFKHYTFPSLPANIATALATTNGCTVKVELNLSNPGTAAVFVDKLSFGQAGGGSGGSGGTGGTAGTGGSAGSSAAGKSGGGSGGAGAGGKAGSGGSGGAGAGGKSGAGGSGGAGAGGKAGTGGVGGAGAGGKAGSGGAGGAGAGGKAAGGGVGGAAAGVGGKSGSGGAGGAGAGGKAASGGAAAGGKSGNGGAGAGGAGAGGKAGAGGAGAAGAAGSGGGSTSVEFFIDLPVHVSRQGVALGASGGALVLSDGVRVLATPSGFSSVSSVKTTTATNLGASAAVQNLWSEANVVALNSGAVVHGNLTTEGTVSPQTNVSILGTKTEHGVLTPIQHQTWSIPFPTSNQGLVNLEPTQVRTIFPGAYSASTLKNGARLVIGGTGIYTLDGAFDVEPTSTLDVDNTHGPVQIYAHGGFIFRGIISPRDPTKNNILIGIAGTGAIPIDSAFNGILVAPNGDVTLGTVTAGHSGAVYAKSINVAAHTDFRHRPFTRGDVCDAGAACDGLCQCDPGGGCIDADDCVTDVGCVGGECGGPGGACTSGGQCGPGLDCFGGVCTSHCQANPHAPECIPPHCSNHVKDGDETGVDCGGPTCLPCTHGGVDECIKSSDCASGLSCHPHNGACFNGSRSKSVCWPTQCEDGVDPTECGSPNSACGQNCECVTPCSADDPSSTCPSGETCQRDSGQQYQSHSRDVCVEPGCPSNDPALCGNRFSTCGPTCVCAPDCSQATCALPSNGCPQGICPGVCGPGQVTPSAGACSVGFTAVTDSDGKQRCRKLECNLLPMTPPYCGAPGAECGDQCPICTPACDGRQCGLDPKCHTSCGSCGTGQLCDGNGVCATPSQDASPMVPGPGGPTPVLAPPEAVTAPVGAVKGMFSVSERGTAEYSIPIDVPPGRAGMEPALSLSYTGARTTGDSGVGWRVDGLSKITRCPHIQALDGYSAPIKNDDTDLLCIDGKRLSVIAGNYGADGAEYRTLVDSFAKIISYRDGTGIQPEPRAGVQPAARASEGPDYFKVWTREGRILTYGHTQDSLIMSQTGVRYSWLLNEIRDRAGNTVAFNYDNFTQQSAPATGKTMPTVARPASIFYTGHFDQSGTRKVAFNYEDRQDLGLKFLQGGMASVTTQRLKTISTYVQDPAAGWKPARTYRLEYGSGAISQLSQVFECEKEGASGDVCKPPTSFTYTEEHGATLVPTPYDLVSGAQLDMNGDGNNDFLISTVTVDGKAMTPALQAALLSTDIATDAAATAYPPVGLPAQITWGIIKMAFWGGDAFRPDIKETDQILLGTSTRGSTMTSLNGNGLPCQAGQPMFLMDYDRDGKDDIAGLCGTSGRGLIINVSAGNGTFIGPPQYGFVLDLPTAYNPSDMSGAPPVMYDIDGDSLQDVVSCKDRWTLEVRRRVGPDAQFADPPLTLAVDPATLHLDEFMPFCGESNPSYNVVDIDGDGTAELLVAGYVNWNVLRYTRTAAGQETLEWQPVAVENTNNSELGGGLVMADVNGDGLLDMASVHGHSEYIWLNTGNGEFVRRDLDRPVIPPAGFTIQGTAPFDHNADGRMDLLEHWQDSQGFSYNLEYSADGWVTSLTQGNTDDIQAPIQNSLGEDVLFPARFRMVADVDGDSNPDLVGDQGVFYGSGAKNTLLSKVVDGLGNVTAIRYDAAAYQNTCTGKTWPEMCAKRMTGLVSGYDQGFIDFIDELGNSHEQLDHTHEFQYFNARYGTTGHGFLGFDRRVETHSEAGPNGGLPGATVTTTEYEPPARYTLDGTPTTGTTPPYIYPLAGMVKRVTTDDSVSATGAASPIEDYSAQRRTKLTNTWQIGISINGKPFPKLFNRETDLFERPADSPPDFDGTPPLSTHLETFDTTPLGNIHEHAELWTGGGGTFESRDTVMFYSDDSSDNWLISNILSRGVSETRGSDSATPDYNYTYDSRGLLQSVHRNGLSSDERHTTTYSLDDFGNPTQIIESVDSGEASRATTITYDEDHVYPATVTDPVNHTVQVHFDARWGTVDTVVNANNVIMQHSRDGLGLASTDVDAEGTTTYAYSTLAVPHSVEVGPTGANQGSEAGPLYPRLQVAVEREGPAGSRVGSVIREVDGRGNAVRTTREGFGGVSVVTEQPVDQRGRVSGVTAPHAAGATAVPTTRYAYDRLNRRIAAQHSDGSVAQWQYASRVNIQEEHIPWMAGISCGNGGSSCIVDVMLEIDENGHEKRVVVTDYQGSVLRSIDGNNIDSIANKNDYTPGAFGRAFLVYDNAGNLTTYDHDEYGRLIHTADRDTTAKIYSYNGFDELKTATDAQNRLRTYSYDDIGRVKTVIDASGQTTWTYDFGVNALGRLSSMASPPTSENPGGQQVVYSYEPVASVNRALLNRVDYFIDGVDYAIKYGHDDLGRTSHIDYPDLGNGPAVSVNYHYDSTGILTSLTQVQGSGENELWAMTSATEGYLLHTEEFGNLAQTTYDYTPDQRWLAGIKTSLNGQPQQDLAYTYDDNGQIFSRTDNLTHVRQEHHYDALDRLHSLVQIDLGGTHPSTDYDYDNIGNLTQRGGTTLTYAPGGSHFVNTVGPNSYHYDINGNVETRSGADVPGGSQSFTYTSFDLPRSITTGSGAAAKTTLFEYSADQSRLVRRDPDQVHHFAGDLYQRVATPSGTTEDERFRLYLGTRLLGEIVRKDGADKTEYFHTDHLGSVDLISVAGQSTVIRDDFDPFGKELTPSNPEATRAGFTGQDHDRDLALIDMRGRLYDPTAGRFMSADPVTESPFTTQGLNRYSYVFNDPINLTDPSGFFAVFPGYPEGAVFVFDESALAGLAGSVGLGAINTPLTLEIPTTAQSGTYRLGPIGSHAPAGSGVGLGAPDAVGQNDGSVGPKTSDLRLAQNAGDPGTGTNIPGNVPDTVARPDVPPRLGPGASAAAVATARAAAELAEAAEATLTRIAAFLDSITAAVAINSPVAGLLTCGDSPCGTYIKAPGIPTEADGFEAPKNWDGRAVPNPNGSGVGYPDSRGRVWIPTGEGPTAHGGPHWDVQKPGGGYDNVYPRGRVRPGK